MNAQKLFVLLTLVSICAYTQEKSSEKVDSGWNKELVGNLNFTQNNFDNWTQGGEDSWSWQLDIYSKFINEHEKYQWSNTGKFSFGRTQLGGKESRKASDEIKLESVFTYKLGIYINPYVAVTGLTQFAKGYKYLDKEKIEVSDFIDPAYFTQSIGIGYEPVKEIKTRFGAAVKETITKDHPVPYTDDPKTEKVEKTKVEPGIESITDCSIQLSKIILYTSKLELFSDLENIESVDVNWDNLLTSKISKYITVSFNFRIFYDRDISAKRQMRQVLAVGLSYSLF